MKKFLSLVLAASMMLGAAALCESGAVQNELPPELVAASVNDAQGALVAEVTEEGGVVLTDVHARETVEAEEVKVRLTAAYEGVMKDVHHSDVLCALHQHIVRVDIDDVLANVDPELDAHDLVMSELFDVEFSQDVKAQLVNGNTARVTLQLDSWTPMPLIVLYSANGDDWTVILYETVGEQQIVVDLSAAGTVALLSDGRVVAGIGEAPEQEVAATNVYSEPVEADNFTASATGKPAPGVELIPGEDGETYVGEIGNNNDETRVLVPNRNYVLVTAPVESTFNPDVQTYEHLAWAYNSIMLADNVGTLPSEQAGTIAADLDALLQAMNAGLTHDQLVVKDLFEVSAYGDYLDYLYDDAYYLEMTFVTDVDPDKTVVVIHSYDSVLWHVHPAEDVVVHEDGKVTLRMYDLGTVAVLVEAEDAVSMENAVQSPN